MKETLVYGGTFNPPTLAHMKIVETCQERFPESDIWVMPSGIRRDKVFDTDKNHRINLIQAMIRDLPFSGVVEIDQTEMDDEVTETVATVERHKLTFPGRSFRYIFGADSYLSMPTWDRGDVLQQELPMLIVPRDGSHILDLAANAELLELPQMSKAISSTLVRENIAKGEHIGNLVCKGVAEYIEQTRLYR